MPIKKKPCVLRRLFVQVHLPDKVLWKKTQLDRPVQPTTRIKVHLIKAGQFSRLVQNLNASRKQNYDYSEDSF